MTFVPPHRPGFRGRPWSALAELGLDEGVLLVGVRAAPRLAGRARRLAALACVLAGLAPFCAAWVLFFVVW